MTKQEILERFRDINEAYNDSSRFDSLSRMLDELLKEQPQIVRCKDCIFGEQINDRYICTNAGHCQSKSNEPDWFCADGEKEGR